MKTRPILFSAPMIRAQLEGRKTHTRRLCEPAQVLSECVGPFNDAEEYDANGIWFGDAEGEIKFQCPYGKPGDLLWVREAFRFYSNTDECGCSEHCSCPRNGTPLYRSCHDDGESKWKPSIHMPRWASRITLEITAVRVEQLQDISETDAIAEGCCLSEAEVEGNKELMQRVSLSGGKKYPLTARTKFFLLWSSIHGGDKFLSGPNCVEANPWVWVVEFRVHRCNVDDYLRRAAA